MSSLDLGSVFTITLTFPSELSWADVRAKLFGVQDLKTFIGKNDSSKIGPSVTDLRLSLVTAFSGLSKIFQAADFSYVYIPNFKGVFYACR